MLTLLALAFQACLTLAASKLTTCSKDSWFERFKVSRDLKTKITSLMNASSSLLFFGNKNLEVGTSSSIMEIVIIRGT